jgi:hypothetical protein
MMDARRRLPQLPIAPEEGWLSLILVAAMGLILAASIDDAGWVVGNKKLTDFLMIATLLGVLVGFVGSKVGWNRWLANTIGAVLAALIVPILVQAASPASFQPWNAAIKFGLFSSGSRSISMRSA